MMKWMICQLGKVNIPKLISHNLKHHNHFLIPLFKEQRVVRVTRKPISKLLYQNYIFVNDIDAFNHLKKEYIDIHLLKYKEQYYEGNLRITRYRYYEMEEDELLNNIEASTEKLKKMKEYDLRDKVKVLTGPFAGTIATVTLVSENKVKLKLNLFNRILNIDFLKSDLEHV